jgi:hypothetical protein
VTVVLNGFVWQEQTYPSLTTVARAITGTSWNGPRAERRSVPHCSRQKFSRTKPETTAQRPRWLAGAPGFEP